VVGAGVAVLGAGLVFRLLPGRSAEAAAEQPAPRVVLAPAEA
jgi:F0F1-type ATP synthase membrane subunit c/vacuolar-type H+-ATPase subunit K